MPQKYRLLSLIVICFTLLFFTWMIRDSLCELHIKQESYELAAFPGAMLVVSHDEAFLQGLKLTHSLAWRKTGWHFSRL